MAPPLPPHKAAWQWAECTKPEEITSHHILIAYRMNLNFCNSCRRNVKGNPNCLSGLGEKAWLSDSPSFDDSDLLKEKNSHVGLKNLGATCYANAFLQVWFHMPEIRDAVFSWSRKSIGIEEDAYSSVFEIITCLQEVFGLLNFSRRKFVDPTILLNCLLLDNTVQQDAQEFSKLFMSKLEELPNNGRSIFHDFVGEYDYVTSCTHCGNQTRSRSEFYELDLNIINNKKLSSCLEEFLQQETLEGDNQFFCSTCGTKQNATRCIELVRLPPTLNLQLLRFVYNKEKQSKKKISSPLTFPEVLDMTPYVKQRPEDRREVGGYIYDLFAILIHSGQLASSGHYIAVVRDAKEGTTYQFNDEKVIKLDGELSGYDLDNALDEKSLSSASSSNNGNNNNKTKKSKTNREMSLINAYMLVYRRRQDASSSVELPREVKFEDLPSELREKICRHDEELEQDLLRERQKQEILLQKRESINLLYSTLMSYEGCSSEVKLDGFEFVPTQNLIKFLQISEVGPANKDPDEDKVVKREETAALGSDNDDLDASAVTCGYSGDNIIPEGKYFCKHKKLDPDEVSNFKLIPTDIVNNIASHLALSTRLPCSEFVCRECVTKKCGAINAKMMLNEDNKRINSLMKSKQYQPDGYLVGKDSWRSWRKNAERNLLLESGDAGCLEPSDIDQSDDPRDAETSSIQSFNTDLLCCHNQLDPNEQNWKSVSVEVWQTLKKYFPACPQFPFGAQCCAICEVKSHEEQISLGESKQQAVLLKQLLNDLYLNRKRPTLLTLRKQQKQMNEPLKHELHASMTDECKAQPKISSVQREVAIVDISDDNLMADSRLIDEACKDKEVMRCKDHSTRICLRYYLVSSMFIERWKKCYKDASRNEMPISVCNRLLVCHHDKLLFDPWDSDCVNDFDRQYVLLWPDEWETLKNYVGVDQEIFVEVARDDPLQPCSVNSVPDLCTECLEEKKKEEIQLKFRYEKAKIYIYKLDGFDSESSSGFPNHQSAITNNDNFDDVLIIDDRNNDDKSRKRKLEEDVSMPNEKYPRLECSAALRRSGRRSKNRGEKEVIVSSSMTLRQLNFEIFHLFQIYKTNQVLYMDGRELVGDDCTLGELCVPPEALIKLEVHEDVDESFAAHAGSIVEEGFKGTGLVG